ncbi:MAG TPA: toll/interleukin-1 receptor domain-containing protein [Thermoanaerobaculia bacterium]|nr:toll/interleukin-1 receptor domain-containing protein [Thermoanaerobaculia bacterium]
MEELARVFISHSAADREEGDAAVNVEAHAVRVAIRDALVNDGNFHILLDEVKLHPGDAWRARINLWLGLCDAAVLILSPAALRSHYVAFEANILGYRWSLDPTFKIIPVLVGVSMDDVDASPLNPARVVEWQAAVQGTPAEAAASILDAIQGLKPSTSRRAYRMAEELEGMLSKNKSYLQSASAVLEIPKLPWAPADDAPSALALRMLGSGMTDACARAIRYFHQDRAFNRDYLPDIANLIAAAWVDVKTEIIYTNASSAAPQPILSNASHRLTAQAYMDAAKHFRLPALNFVLLEAPFVMDEKKGDEVHAQAVIAKVRETLEAKFGSPETTRKALDRAKRQSTPIVVAIHEECLKPDLLARLQTTFDPVLFFVLGGDKAGEIVGRELLVVTPPLAEQDENDFIERHTIFTEDVTTII